MKIGNFCGMLHGTWSAATSAASQGVAPASANRTTSPWPLHPGAGSYGADPPALDAASGIALTLPEDFRFVSGVEGEKGDSVMTRLWFEMKLLPVGGAIHHGS